MITNRFMVLMMENVSSETSPRISDELKLPTKCIRLHTITSMYGKLQEGT